jgi:SAM-dependent methyltransferase
MTDIEQWSALADLWVRDWARLADPARHVVLDATAIGTGTRVLDMGCGTGEFLDMAATRGAEVAGIDAAQAMVSIGRWRMPGADLRIGSIEDLPWPDDAFDVVTAFNAVQFAADRRAAMREAARVVRPGGHVAVTAWAADAVCEVEAVSIALEELAAGAPAPRGPRLGEPGIIEELTDAVGLEVRAAHEVAVPYEVPDDETLQRAFRLDAVLAGAFERAAEDAVRATIADAARPFRRKDGSYRFENVFRVVVSYRAT